MAHSRCAGGSVVASDLTIPRRTMRSPGRNPGWVARARGAHVGLVRLQLLQDRPCLVVWSRSVVASERLHSWLEIQGAGGLGQSAVQGGETGATLTAQQV